MDDVDYVAKGILLELAREVLSDVFIDLLEESQRIDVALNHPGSLRLDLLQQFLDFGEDEFVVELVALDEDHLVVVLEIREQELHLKFNGFFLLFFAIQFILLFLIGLLFKLSTCRVSFLLYIEDIFADPPVPALQVLFVRRKNGDFTDFFLYIQ